MFSCSQLITVDVLQIPKHDLRWFFVSECHCLWHYQYFCIFFQSRKFLRWAVSDLLVLMSLPCMPCHVYQEICRSCPVYHSRFNRSIGWDIWSQLSRSEARLIPDDCCITAGHAQCRMLQSSCVPQGLPENWESPSVSNKGSSLGDRVVLTDVRGDLKNAWNSRFWALLQSRLRPRSEM